MHAVQTISGMEFFALLTTSLVFIRILIITVDSSDDFSAVTAFKGLTSLYWRMKIREPHLDPNPTMDAATKERICRSITTAGYFAVQYKEFPVNMTIARPDLEAHLKNDSETYCPNVFIERILRQDYEEGVFTYRTSLTLFSTDYGDQEEFAFACASKEQSNGDLNIYYISEPYNVNLALDVPSDKRIRACFVCLVIVSQCKLVALAEEAAKVAFSRGYPRTLYTIEFMYHQIQMAQFYDVAKVAADDPVCRLSRSEKLRVCATVLSASCFGDRVKKFNPDLSRFQGKCKLRDVYFLSPPRERFVEDDGRIHTQWMLSCHVEMVGSSKELVYYVSRAYHSHYAFVYIRHSWFKNWHLENIVTNVSVVIDKSETIPEKPALNLTKLLEKFTEKFPNMNDRLSPNLFNLE